MFLAFLDCVEYRASEGSFSCLKYDSSLDKLVTVQSKAPFDYDTGRFKDRGILVPARLAHDCCLLQEAFSSSTLNVQPYTAHIHRGHGHLMRY